MRFTLKRRDPYEPDDEPLPPSRKESNFTVLTINEIMDEQMSQISRIAELFEVREPGSNALFLTPPFRPSLDTLGATVARTKCFRRRCSLSRSLEVNFLQSEKN